MYVGIGVCSPASQLYDYFIVLTKMRFSRLFMSALSLRVRACLCARYSCKSYFALAQAQATE